MKILNTSFDLIEPTTTRAYSYTLVSLCHDFNEYDHSILRYSIHYILVLNIKNNMYYKSCIGPCYLKFVCSRKKIEKGKRRNLSLYYFANNQKNKTRKIFVCMFVSLAQISSDYSTHVVKCMTKEGELVIFIQVHQIVPVGKVT